MIKFSGFEMLRYGLDKASHSLKRTIESAVLNKVYISIEIPHYYIVQDDRTSQIMTSGRDFSLPN